MDPIAKTAWYCCGARAADARSERPVCGDHLADRFMEGEAQAVFQRFAGRKFQAPNVSNATRHRIIDDLLRERLRAQPDLPVVLLGAGFDTRAFRLTGGRWLELDQPAVIALKEEKLPAAQAPNPLQRIAIDFARDSLADKLAPWAGTPGAVVVMEGVSMYLEPDALRATASTLQRLLPGHTLVCDMIDSTFVRRYSGPLRQAIRELGGEFAAPQDDPAGLVASLGYRKAGEWSVVGRSVELGALQMPRWLLNTLMRSLRDGYRVYRFEAAPH
ncbi:MAG: class I SAM-dependent methyltransferase [Rhizobacter sp.]